MIRSNPNLSTEMNNLNPIAQNRMNDLKRTWKCSGRGGADIVGRTLSTFALKIVKSPS